MFLSGCTGGSFAEQREKTAKGASGDIVIGVSSDLVETASMMDSGVKLAAEEINSSGGLLNGRKLKIISRDDDGIVKKAQSIAEDFGEDINMTAVIGHSSSAASIPASILYQYNGLVMVSPLATSIRLTDNGYNKIFRNIPNDRLIGEKAAEFCKKSGFEKVMIYHLDDEYGEGQGNAFEMKAEQLQLSVADRVSYPANASSLQIEKDLKYWHESYEFDALYIAGLMPKAAEIIAIARSIGIDVPIIGGESLHSPRLFSIAGSDLKDVYIATVTEMNSENPLLQQFIKDYTSKYNVSPSGDAVQGYDAVMVLAAGINQAGSTIPSEIAKAMHNLKNYKGIKGSYNFDENGDISGQSVIIQSVKNGEYIVVE